MAKQIILRTVNLIVSLCTTAVRFFPYSFRKFFFVLFRNTPGVIGIKLRYIFFSTLVNSCGKNVNILENVYFYGLRNISVGDNVSIHQMCYISAAGGLEIGSNVAIAHNVSILTTNHQYVCGGGKSTPIRFNPLEYSPVHIADDVWIGCGVRVLAGVRVNTRAILAAGAVVIKDVNSNSIVAGVPAKKVKDI